MSIREGSETTCKRCRQPIVLFMKIQGGKYILAANPARYEWKCQPTAQYPVRGHVPERYANGEICHESVS